MMNLKISTGLEVEVKLNLNEGYNPEALKF